MLDGGIRPSAAFINWQNSMQMRAAAASKRSDDTKRRRLLPRLYYYHVGTQNMIKLSAATASAAVETRMQNCQEKMHHKSCNNQKNMRLREKDSRFLLKKR